MTQAAIDQAVAKATGERLWLVEELGFGIADPLEVEFDPEPREPLAFDWDGMAADLWPCCSLLM